MSMQKAFALKIPDMATLQAAYMPFLEHGGIFVPTETPCALGSQVHVFLTLPEAHAPVEVAGKVAWISPVQGACDRMPGIGVHFALHDNALRERIEGLLAGQAAAAPGYTL
ncbi:type IV pilus assembly protein PilZ [Vreelandella songnenensis]|uniref:Type IV pilus assembly protein PilZ n=1 Tax=Vreelandella songnenensis TaxID=1176243 RepID=A0A2T0V7E6_9GAMM|nr:PilZ domain-containing protein [Halomonas songnenensis]PRY66071.1 type IV pilus assembly protein PilZ [Halomonas songnenensis]